MKVHFAGRQPDGLNSHLAQTLARAAELRGLEVSDLKSAELAFVAIDVLDHVKLAEVDSCVGYVRRGALKAHAIVIVSQVPPGYTRKVWATNKAMRLYYQVDTIIMDRAVARARSPEQFVVGCADPVQGLPLAYQQYLAAFECPVLRVSYESAEMAKCAINYVLAKQIEAANELELACAEVGADYAHVRAALHNDSRIGPHAYLRPGEINQHLGRDVETVYMLERTAKVKVARMDLVATMHAARAMVI